MRYVICIFTCVYANMSSPQNATANSQKSSYSIMFGIFQSCHARSPGTVCKLPRQRTTLDALVRCSSTVQGSILMAMLAALALSTDSEEEETQGIGDLLSRLGQIANGDSVAAAK